MALRRCSGTHQSPNAVFESLVVRLWLSQAGGCSVTLVNYPALRYFFINKRIADGFELVSLRFPTRKASQLICWSYLVQHSLYLLAPTQSLQRVHRTA
jgi:hypothetical protein